MKCPSILAYIYIHTYIYIYSFIFLFATACKSENRSTHVHTGLIKINQPRFVSGSHKQGNMSSNLKFLRRIAHGIDILLAEFQIRTVSCMATLSL